MISFLSFMLTVGERLFIDHRFRGNGFNDDGVEDMAAVIPISLMRRLIKIIAEVLANKMKEAMNHIIFS